MSSIADKPASPTWQRPPARQAYILLAALVALNLINFVDRQLLASFANYVVPELRLSNTEFGLLTGFVFVFMYVVSGIVMGAIADSVHRPPLVAMCLALWSGLTALSGAAHNFVTIAIPRAFIGVGESALTPSALSMLTDAFPSSKSGMAFSLYYLGLPIGSGLSLVLAGTLGERIGWRNCFFALGVIGIVFATLVYFLKDPKPPQFRGRDRASLRNVASTMGETFAVLLTSRNLRLTALGLFLLNFTGAVQVFDQLWLVRERGFPRAEIALVAGYIYVGAGIVGVLFGAFAGDYALRKWRVGRMPFLLGMLLILAPCAYLFRLAPPNSWLFWLGFAGVYFQLSMYVGPFYAVVQELTPDRVRATTTAAFLMLSNLGLAAGNLLGGVAVDFLDARGVHGPYTVAMIGAHLIANISLICFALVRYDGGGAGLADRGSAA